MLSELKTKEKSRKHIDDINSKFPLLKEYENVLFELLKTFYDKESRIVIELTWDTSELEQTQYNKTSKNYVLHVGIKNRVNPMEIIWSILHEYGHLQQNPPTLEEQTYCTEEKYNRECGAWKIGEKKFYEFKELLGFKEGFLNYAEICGESYNPKNCK